MAHARNPRGTRRGRWGIAYWSWLAGMAIVAVLAGGTLVAYGDPGAEDIVLPQVQPRPTVSMTATAVPSRVSKSPPPVQRPGPTITTRTPVPSSTSKPPRSAPEAAPLSCEGILDPHSRDYWAQNNLILHVRRELRALVVAVQVARTERVEPTGAWLSLPSADFQSSTQTTGSTVVFRWTLLPGRTIRPGSYTLAAQYNRTAVHDPRNDTFTVTATPRDGRSITSVGHF